ncbi:MAG: YdeI/OmpD-associated family protein [Devosia sp.]
MAPVKVDPQSIRAFKTLKALEGWYKKNHAETDELWLRVYKRDSGVPSVTIEEALNVALCWGWIDAIRKSLDVESYLQRYTPRKKTSIWSVRNQQNVARLIKEGRMQPEGQSEIDRAKADGRWDKAYEVGDKFETPADLLAAIKAEPKALAFFGQLSSQNRFALAFRTHNMKTEAGRKKRIADFVAMLKRGETIYPNGKGRKA